jgi:hypothetical protein
MRENNISNQFVFPLDKFREPRILILNSLLFTFHDAKFIKLSKRTMKIGKVKKPQFKYSKLDFSANSPYNVKAKIITLRK